MQYLEHDSVLAVIDIFGEEDVGKAIRQFPIYNDEANRQTGEWIDINDWQLFEPNYSDGVYTVIPVVIHTAECSNCQATITIDDYDNYCPRCGAKMK